MNREYIYLSDTEVLVTNEHGHAEKRIIESNDLHQQLLLENNLEEVNNLINKIENELAHEDEIKIGFLGKAFAGTLPFWFTAVLCLADFGISAVSNKPPMAPSYTPILISGICASGAIDAMVALGGKRKKKWISGRKTELSKAYEIKESLEKELVEIKEKHKTLAQKKENGPSSKQHDIIVLEDNNPTLDEIRTQLYDSFIDGYSQNKPKKLVLKKK